jgi:hypothetical protein
MEDEGFNDRDFGAHSRSFSTCSPTLRVSSRDSHARLTSGWLAGLYREGVEPTGSLRKVSDHMVIPLSCHPDATIVPPKIPHGGFSLSTAPKLACQIGPSLIPLRLSLLPAFPLRRSSLPPPFVLSAAAWVLRSMSESTCSVEHHHASDLRRSTPRVLAPVRVMLSRAIIT